MFLYSKFNAVVAKTKSNKKKIVEILYLFKRNFFAYGRYRKTLMFIQYGGSVPEARVRRKYKY